MKIMAVDFGDVRTGICLSDPTCTLASRSMTVTERSPEKLADVIAETATLEGVTKIVLGYPKNMNASEGPRTEKTRAFAELLHSVSGIEVVLWDERLTTTQAHSILSETGKRVKKHKGTVDSVAASLILQGYLDFLSSGRANGGGGA